MRGGSILTEMCDIVIDALPSHEQWTLNGPGFQFAEELAEIQSLERREWLESYVCNSAFFLLHGIIDQVYKLDSCIHTRSRAVVDVTEQILNRTILEYYGKLCYLVDLIPEKRTNERIKRAIKLAYEDVLQHQRFPSTIRRSNMNHRECFLVAWYNELTNLQSPSKVRRELRQFGMRGIFENIEDESKDRPWSRDKQGNLISPMYEFGYQIHSKLVHGNAWAILNLGMTKADRTQSDNSWLPGVDQKTKLEWAYSSGRVLQNSYGLTMQFIGSRTPYTGTMNQLNPYLNQLQEMILE